MQPADRPWYRRPWLTPVAIVVVSAALGALAAPDGPPAAASGACDRSYPDLCLNPNAEDYDCQGGSGNGPRYVDGPIRVRPPDQFDLDSDGDGLGCE
jgi:hypothetical protein